MERNYERSANYAQRVAQSYEGKLVSHHWIAETNCFWYRKEVAQDRCSFFLVDAEKGICQAAFHHEKLAKALQDQGIDTKVDALPFTWIDPRIDGKCVKFRVGEKKWQFDGAESLTEYDGNINEESLKAMEKEKPSSKSNIPTAITFINRTKQPISISWVDWDGKVILYCAELGPGRSNRRPTSFEHIWRVKYSETDQLVASFSAEAREAVAIIEEGMQSLSEVIEKPSEHDTTRKIRSPEVRDQDLETLQQTPEAFIKDHNVWVRDDNDRETKLTTSGSRENGFDGKQLHRLPGSDFRVVYQHTSEQDHKISIIESSPKDRIEPRLKQFQYLKPGDKVRIDRPRMFNLAEKREIPTDDKLFQNPYRVEHMGWSFNGDEYQFLYLQRGYQIMRIIGMDTGGNVRAIMEETTKTFLNYAHKLYWHNIRGSEELIWASERDGWNHLYLYDLRTGQIKNQITKGQWVMRSVERVDDEKRQIWFKVFGMVKDQDPYYAQLARVNFDGSGLTMLTEGDGTHWWSWSPNHKYLLDTWSRVDLAPQSVLRDAETGKQVLALAEGTLTALKRTGWEAAERFAAPGRDGKTKIYGIIIRPSDFDSHKKYPVIEEIYAGPQDFFVPKAFSALVKKHELAELGFIVVQIDGMGTNWRSKDFHDVCYKNLRDAGLPDRIAWMKAAAADNRPWMDLSRVGIHGISAGGQNALAAMLWHGDFYKAAVADSGCHDNRMDKLWWNEQWMGWPVDQSYEDSSNVVHAGRLQGALMLIVGELDDNVDPSTTMQVVNALNKAEKDYELLYVPGSGHGAGERSQYGIRRQRDFFIRHLLGLEPPNRNKKAI